MREETMPSSVVDQTRQWLQQVVVGLGLCPFAQQVIDRDRVRYCVTNASETETLTEVLLAEIEYLTHHSEVETTLLIHPRVLGDFEDYLDYLDMANAILTHLNYEGVYQIASFHPAYLFADSDEDDPANYSNRSPYPMLHLLREKSVEEAIASYADIDAVPALNIIRLREMGLAHIKQLAKC